MRCTFFVCDVNTYMQKNRGCIEIRRGLLERQNVRHLATHLSLNKYDNY